MKYLGNIKRRVQTDIEDKLTFMTKVVCFYRFNRELSVQQIQYKFNMKNTTFSGHFKLCLDAFNIDNNDTDMQKVTKMQNRWFKYFPLWRDPFESFRKISP
jgi:hypothetical protein